MPAMPDIKPRLLVTSNPPEQLELCSKVVATTDPEFWPGSLVPGEDWVPAPNYEDNGETPWVDFEHPSGLSHNVVLLTVPPGLLGGHLVAEGSEAPPIRSSEDLEARVDGFCRSLSSVPDELSHRGIFQGFRGASSVCTTRHPVDRRLVGLHVDALEKHPVTFVDRAASRFCVNLGPTRRWFVFAPLSLTTVVAECGLSEQDVLVSKHFQHALLGSGATPVCRLALRPGDAYIAPTQLLLHDGQSETVAGGRMYSVVGRFDKTEAARRFSKA
jgi:hypothetical protein